MRSQRGLATFETAIIIAALTAVCFAALGLIDYLNRFDSVWKQLDREIHNSAVKASLIHSDSQSGAISLRVNHASLRNYLERLRDRLPEKNVEVAYAIADIDPISGALIGVEPPSFRIGRGVGHPRITASCPGIETELLSFANAQSSVTPSILAVPDGGTSQTSYLPTAIIVVGRVEVDFSDAPITSAAISGWGGNLKETACSAAVLRGEIGQEESSNG